MKKESVPIQKGPIKADQPTYRSMPHSEKVKERSEELRMLRDGMTLKEHQPKR